MRRRRRVEDALDARRGARGAASASTEETIGKFCRPLGPPSASPSSFGNGSSGRPPAQAGCRARRCRKIAFPRIVTAVRSVADQDADAELPAMMLRGSGVGPPIVEVLGPLPRRGCPFAFGIGGAAFLSRPMMLPWIVEFDPPLKLLLARSRRWCCRK